ncbi:TPA: hypothetical protein EYP44_05780, partial [Candidatus Bathyarchaeota archaeon]|nr:hypothetical protein [Candidatus Bathyarchaeota archaeon]
MRILAIDIGTTNVKGGVFDEGGRAVSMASVGVPMHFPAPGSAVQRLDELYGAVVRASRGALRGARATEVDVVALSAQMHGLAAIDGGGRELLPLVTYLDTRASAALPS